MQKTNPLINRIDLIIHPNQSMMGSAHKTEVNVVIAMIAILVVIVTIGKKMEVSREKTFKSGKRKNLSSIQNLTLESST
jgi:hypothetical protein